MATVMSRDPMLDGFPGRNNRLSHENQYQCCCGEFRILLHCFVH